MKKVILYFLISCSMYNVSAQSAKTEMYDLIKKLIPDSFAYEEVGDWGVGEPKKYPVKWQADNVVMSDDTSINFYRRGTVDIAIKGRSFMQSGQPVKWNIMLKGPRMGYTSFSIISSPSNELPGKFSIDSIFGKKPFTAKLLKSCDTKSFAGYYYYELKLPKKSIAFMKLSWISINGSAAIRIDCFDSWSKYAVKLDCAK
ncbi:MAG TPA: hypothetical protein VMY77_07485 [Chitinophagaceae bacterium]|nr:hypothetical protein [Chitinophagaceae bacterium]